MILAHGRGDRRALQEPMADRTAVPLDQAASLYPQVPRQQRERHSAANPRGDDRLSAAAHRGAGPLHHHAANPSRSARQPTPVLATHDYANRQTYTGQPQQPQATQMTRPDGFLLCLTFPRTALRTRGEVERAARALPPPSSEPYAIALPLKGRGGAR